MTGLIRIGLGTEDLLDKTDVASKVRRNLINIGLGFGLEVLYFPSRWKSLIDDLERAGSILVSTFCMASMSCFSLAARELFGWDSLIPYMTTLNSLSDFALGGSTRPEEGVRR